MSPKNQVELRECAAQLDVQLLTIGKMLDTRWVASSVRTVKAVWESYPALRKHFVTAAQDHRRDAKEKAVYLGLAERLSSREFVQNLALMYDALQELAELSLELQRRNVTLPIAHRAISRQVMVFDALCEKSGPHLQLVDTILKSDNAGTFKGVALHNGKKCDVLIKREQFLRSLSNNLKNRLLTLQSSHVSSTDTSNATEYSELIAQVKVLYPENWSDLGYNDPLYGEEEVALLTERLNLNTRPIVRAFREFKENGGRRVPEGLQPLLLAIDTIPVCTAECERGFSQMNLILSPTRNYLCVSTVADLLFGKLVGPPVTKFEPKDYVLSWLAEGRHSADDTNSKSRTEIEFDLNLQTVWKLL